MDNQSKRIADLVVELIGAMKVELTPKGLMVEDILGVVDDAIVPYKDEMQERSGGIYASVIELTESVVTLQSDVREIDTEDLESRIEELENADDDTDVEQAVEQFCRSREFRREVQEIASEAINDYDFSENVNEAVGEYIRDDSELHSLIRRVVQDEITNCLQVLRAHWADN